MRDYDIDFFLFMSYECNKKKLVVKSRTFFLLFIRCFACGFRERRRTALGREKQTKAKIKGENKKKIFSWMKRRNINNYNALI
jgi:hypothetical protein